VTTSNKDIPVSIRLHPFKPCERQELPVEGEVPWSPYGRYLSSRPSFTLDPLFHAGAYYVQDASAMFVGHVFRQACKMLDAEGVVTALDLCAAPGGKSTDMAASLRESFGSKWALFSNEVIRQRAAILADNMARWGDPNVCVTSSDPKEFARIPALFDIMVADVPCSGEGMFRKSENARAMFSDENVNLCASRARRIVADAWESLKAGGYLVFSTCTYPREENDGNVEWICENLGAEVIRVDVDFEGHDVFENATRTDHGFLLTPESVRGEGQYCALLRKNGTDRTLKGRSAVSAAQDADDVAFFDRGGEIYALGSALSSIMGNVGKKLNVISCGIHAFTVKGKDRIPCEDLALSLILDPEDFPAVDLSLEQALSFLHKDAMKFENCPLGYLLMRYQGLPLGFVNNLGGRANNLHPASRRILMNVK